MRVTAHRAVQALSAFAGDLLDLVAGNPSLLLVLSVLAIVVFQITKPRVR